MLATSSKTFDEAYLAQPDAVPRIRTAVVELAARAGATPDQLERIRLAISEAAANVVRHAYPKEPGMLHVTAAAMDDELCVLVADEGCGTQTPPADPGLGWGLALIAEAADEFVLAERSLGGTEARMRFALS